MLTLTETAPVTSRAQVRDLMPADLPDVSMPQCDMRKILKGQKALVTGANSGIGRAVAIALCRAGADVIINYRDGDEQAQQTIEEATHCGCKTNGRAIAIRADVSKEADVRGMFQQMFDELGTIDILVPNAGIQLDAPIERMTLQQWNTVLGVNLTGQFLCCQEAIREFKRRGVRPDVSCAAGKIVCMSSVHEVIPWAGHVNYAASKGGVMLLMKSLAQEVAPYRIRVNSIAPGAIRTPINRPTWETSEAYADLMKLIPYKRIGEPQDIARTAVWLASDEADYITGTTIFVDGGMTLYPGFETGG
jgi:glucose 1-dehydrogenase